MKVYVLEIYDRYGDQSHVSVHRTEEGARKRLHRFVQQYWMVRRKIPRKREEAIAVFFEEVDKGDYCIRPYDLEE